MTEQQPDNASASVRELIKKRKAYDRAKDGIFAAHSLETAYDARTEVALTAEDLITALEADNARLRAQLAAATGANAELVEALSVLWRWNATDEFDDLEIEQLNYGFMAAQKRVYDLVMHYGAVYERPAPAATPPAGAEEDGR